MSEHKYLVFFIAGAFEVARGRCLDSRTTTRSRLGLPPLEEVWFEEVDAPCSRLSREGWFEQDALYATRQAANKVAKKATEEHRNSKPMGGTFTITSGRGGA